VPEEKPESPRKSIYQQTSVSGRELKPLRRLAYRVLVPVGAALIRLAWGWARVVRVLGEEHLTAALAQAPSFIPVYWHQHQLFCIRYLLSKRAAGVRLGFLISPSVDGEIGAMLVRYVGAFVIRGSSSHTGARALRDYYQALVQEGVSPVITPDGPRGPPWKVKPGAVLLAQLSQRPIVPLAYAASRAWKIQWDRFIIPWPLARIAIAVGEPLIVPKGLDAPALARHQEDLEARLKALFLVAKAALDKRP